MAFLAGHPGIGRPLLPLKRSLLIWLHSPDDFSLADAFTARRDFDAFTEDLDYGFDPVRMAIDCHEVGSCRRPGALPRSLSRLADYWLANGGRPAVFPAGIWSMRVGQLEQKNGVLDLESTADGISVDCGRPVGRLLVAQWDESPASGERPSFQILGEGGDVTLQQPVTVRCF